MSIQTSKRRFMVMVLLGFFLASVFLPATALGQVTQAGEIGIVINQEVQKYDAAPVLINGRTMVPLRGIFEKLGATVEWCADTRTITGTREQSKIILGVGQSRATVDGQEILLDAPPVIIKDRTMVPVRFIAESLGAQVEWNPVKRSVEIQLFQPLMAAANIHLPKEQKPAVTIGATNDMGGVLPGMSLSAVENLLGGPVTVTPGPIGTELRSYHNQYTGYFLVSYYQNQVEWVYTNQPGTSFAGVSVGSSGSGLSSEARYNKGSLQATFNADASRKLKQQDGKIGIYYLDAHQQNQVSGIRVISPEALLRGTCVLSYRLTYSSQSDLPVRQQFNAVSSMSAVLDGQARIHFELDNAARIRFGLPLFSWNAPVAQVALAHSQDMAKQNYFSHTSLSGLSPFDRMKAAGISYSLAGENLSWGDGYYDAVESHHGLMNSLGHRKNILNPGLRELGIGADYRSGLYTTQNFVTR